MKLQYYIICLHGETPELVSRSCRYGVYLPINADGVFSALGVFEAEGGGAIGPKEDGNSTVQRSTRLDDSTLFHHY